MKFSELLPSEAIAKLTQTIKIWFRTNKQTEKITDVLKPYKAHIEKVLPLADLVSQIEKTVEEANSSAKSNAGKKVLVRDGSGQKILGYGKYVGSTKVWVLQMPDGSLRSAPNAEAMPQNVPPGAKLYQTDNNPKIILDDGRVVYGCQVWWEPVDEKDDFPIHAEIKQGNYQWN